MERFAIKIDKKLRANLYKICRLCGMDNSDMVPILSDKEATKDDNVPFDVEAEMEMSQKINLLIGISVTKDDRMPQTMCGLCVDKINDFYEFREMCYATNSQTRKLLGLKAIKTPVADIKPKIEVKQEEEIVPTPISSKNGNRKRKADEVAVKEEATPSLFPKKKLRFSNSSIVETDVKEEVPGMIKKKLRFTAASEEIITTGAIFGNANKKTKNSATDDSKAKKEPSPPLVPVVSNKKLRIVAPAQKEAASKKSKQKGSKNDFEVKEEIKEEIQEESPAASAPSSITIQDSLPIPRLKFGCNICSERFPSKGKMETHVRTVHLPKIERYVCTACNEVLNKSFDIKNHQLWHKLSKTPYVCGCCGESILNTYAFTRHLREHAFETPPALLVLDRECPQCHTSYATNFLYNTHICAVRTRRCAGCNRLQRNEGEYLRHSAHCAKVYLNYSKHIMPSVEALEDSVRIKNENDVEAAAEEMARLSGVSLDMAPVVQLTRLSSPIIMAANQCVSIPCLDDSASTSSRKSGKKGVSKKDLKRVDELLKSTLDALVSIKHEPEVHVEQETPSSAENSDNDDNADVENDQEDNFQHNDEDSDNGNENNTTVSEGERSFGEEAKEIKIKQEVEDAAEDNSNKIGFGLKLKIKKEHGQLNSSIIEQQKSTEKRGEKRKKKKKHKDKEKDKQKLSKDLQDEQLSQDSNANNNVEETTIRIKTEPQDGNTGEEVAAVVPLQVRPQPEATIMTSIPMMQFQIACVSSGVEFSNINNQQTASSVNHEVEQEDIKPNRADLDLMIKISNVSSGVTLAANETEMDHDGNDNVENCFEGRSDNDHEDYNDDDSDQHEHCEEEDEDEGNVAKATKNNEPNSEEVIANNTRKPKSKSTLKSREKAGMVTSAPKSRNKACKSTAKPANLSVLQISAVEGGVALESSIANSAADEINFGPIYIKPEPQNRGYSDEQPANTLDIKEASSVQTDDQPETPQTHSIEEQNYISSIDFNNVVIKQEKDIEINDVQITKKSSKSYAGFNGVKRKRKQICRLHIDKSSTANEEREKNDVENYSENMEEDDGFEETDGEAEEEEDDVEETDEVEEEEDEEELGEEEEDEEDQEDEDEEEREYRELEYPPQITEKISEAEEKQNHQGTEKRHEAANMKTEGEIPNLNSSPEDTLSISTQLITSSGETPAFIISSVCSHAVTDVDKVEEVKLYPNSSKLVDSNMDHSKDLVCINSGTLAPTTANIIDTKANNDENTKKFCPITEGEDISETNRNRIAKIDTANHSQCESLNLVTATTHPKLPPQELHGNINSDEMTLRLGQSFEIKPADHGLGFTQDSKALDSAQSSSQVCLKSGQYKSHESDSLTIPTTQILSKHDTQSSHSQNSKNLENNFLLTEQTSQFSQENSQINDQLIPTSQDIHRHYYRVDGQLVQSEENMALSSDKNVYFPGQKSYSNYNVTVQLNDGSEFQRTQQMNQACVGSLSYLAQGCEITDKNRLYSQQNAEGASDNVLNSQYLLTQVDETTFPTLVVENSHISEVKHETQNVQHVSEYLQDPVFKISSVSSAALEDFNHSESNNGGKKIIKDNLESVVIRVEGAVLEDKHMTLHAQPVTGTAQKETCQTDAENDERENESNIEEDDNAEDQQLEERQNYQNQEVLSQIRPAALALHPYLEDISSSSNSLLSNSLSQTPPPPTPNQPTTSNASAVSIETFNTRQQLQPQHDLNNEETENILNESNDILSRRSTANATATSVSTMERRILLPHPHLAQQLPAHVPTFNFDNINEIAENNNNANIEREQLQDEQQQQVSNNVT